MANAYSVTNAEGQSLLAKYAADLGASPQIIIYSGTAPTNADTALSGNTVLATLIGAATPISGYSNPGGGLARATWAAIASAIAAATGTATFFRTLTSGGTVIDQGSVGVSGCDLNLSTTALTAGSTVACSARTVDFQTGP